MKTQKTYKKIFVFFSLLTLLLLSACSAIQAAETASKAIDTLPTAMAVSTATPAPTATPSVLDKVVADVASTTGADEVDFLGLSGEDWLNIGASVIFVLMGYLLGSIFASVVLKILISRTSITFENSFLRDTGSLLRWLIVVFSLQYATFRLTFIYSRFQTILTNIYSIIEWLIVINIVWKAIDYFADWYRKKLHLTGQSEQFDPLITLTRRMALTFLVIMGSSVIMSRFGLNTNVMTITLGIIILGLSLAAQDTITDAISGFIVLADRPFRVGDVIEVDQVEDWGIVQEIGLRTTRVLTYDNRLVIIPNSIIGKNLVVNYTYPDPSYREETRLLIAYDEDVKKVRQIILNTLQQVDGIITANPEKMIKVLFTEIKGFALEFRIMWWIKNYDDTPESRDRVIEAIQNALVENNIQLASPALNVKLTPEMATKLSAQKDDTRRSN